MGRMTQSANDIILETERLVLRELTPEDFDDLYAVLGDADISAHYPSMFSVFLRMMVFCYFDWRIIAL